LGIVEGVEGNGVRRSRLRCAKRDGDELRLNDNLKRIFDEA